jgi:hypothetical protein
VFSTPVTKFTLIQNDLGLTTESKIEKQITNSILLETTSIAPNVSTIETVKEEINGDDVETTTITEEIEYDLNAELKEISPWLPAILKYFNLSVDF